jgi:hypothetical protein
VAHPRQFLRPPEGLYKKVPPELNFHCGNGTNKTTDWSTHQVLQHYQDVSRTNSRLWRAIGALAGAATRSHKHRVPKRGNRMGHSQVLHRSTNTAMKINS